MNIPVEQIVNNPVVPHILVAIARAALGYAENCAEAKKLLPVEFGRVFATIFRVGAQGLGLGALGLPPGSALVSDFAYHAVKKKK